MKTFNYEQLLAAWTGMSIKHRQGEISTAYFKEDCRKFNVSLCNGMMQAYQACGIITMPSRGRVVIHKDITLSQIKEACELVSASRKAYRKKTDEIKAFNIGVIAHREQFTPEACAEFLRSKGWFVYKPSKGEEITITKKISFQNLNFLG